MSTKMLKDNFASQIKLIGSLQFIWIGKDPCPRKVTQSFVPHHGGSYTDSLMFEIHNKSTRRAVTTQGKALVTFTLSLQKD